MTDFKKLKVWQKAHMLAMDVHRVAGQIRGAKHASLRSQMISQVIEVRKMLYGLLRYLKSRSDDESGVPRKATKQA